jgi:Methyltransferase domain
MNEHQQARERMSRYLRWNYYQTEGYLHRLDAMIIREIVAGQIKNEIHGSLAEIGVHYGRSFFLLATGRSKAEKSLAIDLFEDDDLHKSRQGGRFLGFKANSLKYGFALSQDEILKSSSLEISPSEIVKRVGPVRLFSIDGGHMYKHVAHDLALAERVLVAGGVICIDDAFTPLWPEVAIATFDWLRAAIGRFVPFMSTAGKLYVCRPEYVDFYCGIIKQDKGLASRIFRTVHVLEQPVLVLSSSITSKVTEHLIAKLFSLGRRS